MSINFSVRFADNMPELKQHLKEGLDQIEVTRASVEKLTRSLSGENQIKSANNWAAALKALGGEAGALGGIQKLTTAEIDRATAAFDRAIQKTTLMGTAGTEAGKAYAAIAAALKDAKAAAEGASDAHASLGASVQGLGVSFGKLVASQLTATALLNTFEGAVRGVAGFLGDSVKAANDAEHAHVQMAAALKAQGTAIPSVVAAYEGYATALQKTTIFQDDAIEGAEALLVQVGNVMPRDMQKALKATTELASGLGIDLTQATMMVAKAAEGNTTALKKAGVVLDEATAKSGDFGKVLDAVTAKFGGQAEAIANTYAGRLQQLSNTWNNVEESIGRVITQNATVLKLFDDVNKAIDSNTGELKDNVTATTLVSDAVILAVRGVSLLAETLDVVQTGIAGFILSMRAGGQAIGNIGIAILETARAVAIGQGNLFAAADASRGITALKAAVTELGERNLATTQHSVAFGQALDTIGAKADALAADLATTRGKTIELNTATDQGTDAWNRHTKAVGTASEAQKAFAAAMAELNSVGGNWRATLDTIDGTVVEAIKFYLDAGISQEKLAIAYGLTAVQVKSVAESMKAELEQHKLLDKILGVESAGLNANVEAWGKLGKSVKDQQKTFEDFGKFDAQLQDVIRKQTMTTTDYEVAKIEEWRDKTITAMDKNAEGWERNAKKVEEIARREIAAVQSTAESISDMLARIAREQSGPSSIAVIMERQGVKTRATLQADAAEFKRQYEDMLASGKFTTQELADAWDRYQVATRKAIDQSVVGFKQADAILGGLSKTFSQLATVGPASWRAVASSVSTTTSALQGLASAMAAAEKNGFNAATVTGLVSSWVGLAVAVWNVVDGILSADDASDKLNRKIYDASQAAHQFGVAMALSVSVTDQIAANVERTRAALASVPAAQSAAINAQLDDIRAGRAIPAFGQISSSAPNPPGAHGTATPGGYSSGADAGATGTAHTDAAQRIADALAVIDVLKDLGGWANLDAAELEAMRIHVEDLFVAIKLGGPIGAEALGTLDTALTDLGESATKNGGLVDQFFLDMTAKARATGVDLEKAFAFQAAQAKNAETGFVSALTAGNDAYQKRADLQQQVADATDNLKGKTGAALADAQKRLDDLNKQLLTQQHIIDATGIHSQAAAGAVAGGLLGIISSQVAAGASFGDAIRAAVPGIEALRQQLADLGGGGGQAFDFLNQQVELFTGEVTGPALTSIEGYAAGLVGLHNAGQLNQETFAGITEQIGKTEQALEAQGVSGPALLSAMQSPLQKIWELETKFGYAADASTQALVDQAVADGIVGEAHKSVAEQMLDMTDRMTKAIEFVAKTFGYIVPAAEDAADGISDAFKNVKISIPIDFPVTGASPIIPLDGSAATPGDGSAASVGASYAEGSGGLVDFGAGTRVTLHNREAVLTEEQYAAAGRGGGGRTAVLQEQFTFNITLPPGGTTDPDYVEKNLMPQIIGHIEDRRRGYTGRLRRALEVPA